VLQVLLLLRQALLLLLLLALERLGTLLLLGLQQGSQPVLSLQLETWVVHSMR
jgi:hypothetical protein